MIKVICTNMCQKDGKFVFEVGKEYEIEKEIFENNKEFFKEKINKKAE